jgi:hypothetical protein
VATKDASRRKRRGHGSREETGPTELLWAWITPLTWIQQCKRIEEVRDKEGVLRMFKVVAFPIILLLLTVPVAFGSILQGQAWGVGINNDVHLQQSQQNGQSSQSVLIDMSQNTGGTGMALASAQVLGVSRQIGTGGVLGISSLMGNAQLLSLGGLHTPLVINPIGSSSVLVLGGLTGLVPW